MPNSFLKILAVVIIALGMPSISRADYVIHNNPGGDVGEFYHKFRKLAKKNTKVVIIGECYSACTLALKFSNVCVMPNSTFGFHVSRDVALDRMGRPRITNHVNKKGTALLKSAIPPETLAKLKPLGFALQYVKGKNLPERFWCKK